MVSNGGSLGDARRDDDARAMATSRVDARDGGGDRVRMVLSRLRARARVASASTGGFE